MALTKTSIKRPVATSMAFLILIVIGVVGFRYLPIDLLPPIEYPRLTVATEYPNVGPEEIEKIITERIENAVAGVPGVERVSSRSSEGRSRVTLEFGQTTDIDVAANDLRAALDRVRGSFPPEVDPPRIWKFDPNNFPVVIVGANSDMPLGDLTRVLDREITKRFEQIDGVGSIDIWGGLYREVQVELKRDRLIASGLSSRDVQQAINAENVNLPGGDVNSGISQMYVRTLGEFSSVEEIKNTTITTVDGKPIRVRDVANVTFGYEDLDRVVTIDEKPMVRFGIRKQTGANTVSVAENIRSEVERINKERTDLNLFVTTDQSQFIQGSISSVQNSALWGALLAVVVLYLFLRNGSSTFIIAVSIPISIIATFALLYFAGLTLNQMSFGGLALGVGLIVDNAIVVLENIVRLREKGEKLEESALTGTKQVSGAIIASTLTTSVIFLPVVFMQTVSGMLYQELALVVVFALGCSLIVALTLVPMLSSKILSIKPGGDSKKSWFQKFFLKVEKKYSALIWKALSHKKLVYGSTAILLIGSALLLPTIPFELAPQTDADEIDVDLMMADGTNIAVMNQYLQELETLVRADLPMDDIKNVTTDTRDGRVEVEIAMVPSSERTVSTYDLADQIRERVEGKIPGADIRVSAQSGLWILRRVFGSGDGGEAVQVELRGYNLDQAYEIAQDLSLIMEDVPGVTGVRVGRQEGQPEENLIFNREKIADLGLNVRTIAEVVQTNVGGSRAGAYRVDGEEFPITVRLRPQDRLTTEDLDNISVQLPGGGSIPISALVEKKSARGPEQINRINSQRVTYVTANLDSDTPLSIAVNDIRNRVLEYSMPDGFSVVFGGEYQEQQEAQRDFQLSIIMAIILIYMVMAGQFERFMDPLVVMFSVPLAIIGVVPTLILTGTTINIQSLMGFIMLIGIVVNNAIVLVDYINLMRRERGLSLEEAVATAGELRLRPILMTTLTTVLALLPMSFGVGAGAEIQASLARVVIGGLTASTLITLVFIPVLYTNATVWTEQFSSWIQKFKSGSDEIKEAELVEAE
jgi:HAE1 family hydrophobic/amphiphilic exporter-1